MPIFIVDTNVDLDRDQKRYMAAFFRDMLALNGYRVAVGGSRMKLEMRRKEKLLRLVTQYSTMGRIQRISDESVDLKADEIREQTLARLGAIPNECDDYHILALALLADCQNVITNDQRLSSCVSKIRVHIGHAICPSIRNIQSEAVYLRLKSKGQL